MKRILAVDYHFEFKKEDCVGLGSSGVRHQGSMQTVSICGYACFPCSHSTTSATLINERSLSMSAFITFYEEEDLPFKYFHDIWHAARATTNTLQQIDLVAVNHVDAHDLTDETCQKLRFFQSDEYPFLFRIHSAVDHNDAINQLDQLIQKILDQYDFLEQALEEMDGFDGVLLAETLHQFIVSRDGTCPYTLAEIEVWLNEGEEEENEDNA